MSVIELLEAAPELRKTLQDLKRLEKYMSAEEKKRVAELVQKAAQACKGCGAIDQACEFGCPETALIDETEAVKETGQRAADKRHHGRRKS